MSMDKNNTEKVFVPLINKKFKLKSTKINTDFQKLKIVYFIHKTWEYLKSLKIKEFDAKARHQTKQ